MANGAKDPYLLAVLIMSFVFVIYWSALANFRFTTFQYSYYDAGVNLNSFYLHILYPGEMPGLQYLVFANHLSIFALFVTAVLSIFNNPLTIFVLQYIFLAGAALVAYFIGRDVVNNRFAGSALALAFLVSAGTRGIAYYDYHHEAFLPFFFLLAFYFYMRENRTAFLCSLVLLLCVIDTAPLLGVALLAGLLIYEYTYRTQERGVQALRRGKRINSIAIGAMLTFAFLAVYILTAAYITGQYSGAYAATPPSMRVIPFLSVSILSGKSPYIYVHSPTLATSVFFLIIGLSILILGFGLSGIANLPITLAFISPWLFEVAVLENHNFALLTLQYYSYALGGAVAAAAIGMLILQQKGGKPHPAIRWLFKNMSTTSLSLNIISFSMVLSLILLLLGFSGSLNVFTFSNAAQLNFSQISSTLSTIPGNAVVMVQPSITPHLYYVSNLEEPPGTMIPLPVPADWINGGSLYWAVPQYIVVAKPFVDYGAYLNNSNFSIYAYMRNNYTAIASAQNVTVYRRN